MPQLHYSIQIEQDPLTVHSVLIEKKPMALGRIRSVMIPISSVIGQKARKSCSHLSNPTSSNGAWSPW